MSFDISRPPWYVFPISSGDIEVRVHAELKSGTTIRPLVATIAGDTSRLSGNAALIAAAPDLGEAATFALNLLNEEIETGSVLYDDLVYVRNQLQAAIDLARGNVRYLP